MAFIATFFMAFIATFFMAFIADFFMGEASAAAGLFLGRPLEHFVESSSPRALNAFSIASACSLADSGSVLSLSFSGSLAASGLCTSGRAAVAFSGMFEGGSSLVATVSFALEPRNLKPGKSTGGG